MSSKCCQQMSTQSLPTRCRRKRAYANAHATYAVCMGAYATKAESPVDRWMIQSWRYGSTFSRIASTPVGFALMISSPFSEHVPVHGLWYIVIISYCMVPFIVIKCHQSTQGSWLQMAPEGHRFTLSSLCPGDLWANLPTSDDHFGRPALHSALCPKSKWQGTWMWTSNINMIKLLHKGKISTNWYQHMQELQLSLFFGNTCSDLPSDDISKEKS
jgi:hypothetical protein